MSAYRPLFHELGNIAMAILEAAVTPPPRPPGPAPARLSRVGLLIASFESGPALKYALMFLAASRMLVHRLPHRTAIAVQLEYSCGHLGATEVDERIVHLAAAGELYDVFLAEVATRGRPCSCILEEMR